MIPSKRKKWTEAEEKTLIEKYGEMVSDGTLAKMKTRQKKFLPIAFHVNSVHHDRDPFAYPWQWTWMDVSTKVQNMRHQYLLVKQKIKKTVPAAAAPTADNSGGDCEGEEFDWEEGVSYWSNFLRYKEVFGDLAVANGGTSSDLSVVTNGDLCGGVARGLDVAEFAPLSGDFSVGIEGVQNGEMGMGFEYDGKEGIEYKNGDERTKIGDDGVAYEVDSKRSNLKRKKKAVKKWQKRAWGFLVNQVGQLREMEARFERSELERERERERQKRENARMEAERNWERKWGEWEKEREEREKLMEKLRRQRVVEWEAMKKESEEMERRREEQLLRESAWEERMNSRRIESKKRIIGMLNQHRAEMGELQSRILQEQQSLTSQFLAVVSQWTAHPAGLSDHTSASTHYISHMMQNLHQVNGMVHDDTRVEGDNQDDQFLVDG